MHRADKSSNRTTVFPSLKTQKNRNPNPINIDSIKRFHQSPLFKSTINYDSKNCEFNNKI